MKKILGALVTTFAAAGVFHVITVLYGAPVSTYVLKFVSDFESVGAGIFFFV